MNLLLDLENVNTNNIFFTETRQNMMFEGFFTKILYCDEFFTMYGIYVNVSIQHTAPNTKPQISSSTLNALLELETNILKAYVSAKKNTFPNITYKLADMLKTKFQVGSLQNEKTSCLKISGIWENNQTNEVGLSFKF
jgi:hypothetical protein